MNVYVCNHLEIMNFGDGATVDSMVLHVASTEAKAVDYIKKSVVDPWSWWEITEHPLDAKPGADKEYESLGLYGPKGGRLKKAPVEKALEAFYKGRKGKAAKV